MARLLRKHHLHWRLFLLFGVFPLLLQANQNQSSIVPSPTVTAQPSSSSPSPTQLTDSNQSVTTTSEDATEETGVFFLKWDLWQLVSLAGLVFVVILLIVILALCVRNRKLKKELTREKRNAREQQEHLQQQVPSRAAFSIIAASSAEELATILQNERKGQIEQFLKRTDGKDRKGDRFHSYTYSAGTSPKLFDMLRGPQLAALQQHRQSAKTQFQLLSQDSENGTKRDYRKTNLRSGSLQSLEPAKQDNKTKESSAKSKKSRNKILSGPSAISPEERCKSSDSVDDKLTPKKRQRTSVSFAEPHRSSSPEGREDVSLMTQEPKQTERLYEHQKDASPYEGKPNSSDNEPDYKPSIISKVQAFEQGSIKDSGEGEQDKRQEPKREPKKLKPVQFNSTATQPDDSERRKREAEIRPLGGVVKKLHVSPVRTPSVNKDTVDH